MSVYTPHLHFSSSPETKSTETQGSDLANQIARSILVGFDKHFSFFTGITAGARERFERADWRAIQEASATRIKLYDIRVAEAVEKVRNAFTITSLEEPLWQKVKVIYQDLLRRHSRPELAETFYNSVFCRLFERKYYNNHNIFIQSTAEVAYLVDCFRVTYSFHAKDGGFRASVRDFLTSCYFELPFENLERDIDAIVAAFRSHSHFRQAPDEQLRLEIYESPFFRNKAAYLVGRVIWAGAIQPFVVPILNNEHGGLYADTLLTHRDQIARVFSFARAYFMVKTPVPAATIHFLHSLLPTKSIAELYMSIGFQKQAKNEFYRDFLHHLEHSDDIFVIAPGIRGMVMSVFTLPSYPYVFKVIKDRFAPQKEVTRQDVKERYLRVKMHDRVGRMADTLEYSDVAFPRQRFSPELERELQEQCGSLIEYDGDNIVVKHLYIERRLRPLNMFLEQANIEEARAAIKDWGLAIKELMAANIFPGDMLFKNFGLTRHGRVIFYDYDEISYLTECNFRRIPPPRYDDDELSAEPWYSVAPNDVFPEEFASFLTTNPLHRRLLLESHPEIMEAEFWKSRQQDIDNGVFVDIFPYAEDIRFPREGKDRRPESARQGDCP